MAKSGHITVTTAGTDVAGPDQTGAKWYLAAHPDNAGVVWVKYAAADDGFPLKAGAVAGMEVEASNLNKLYFDAATDGDKICYLRHLNF